MINQKKPAETRKTPEPKDSERKTVEKKAGMKFGIAFARTREENILG